jgi:hypothetical protein
MKLNIALLKKAHKNSSKAITSDTKEDHLEAFHAHVKAYNHINDLRKHSQYDTTKMSRYIKSLNMHYRMAMQHEEISRRIQRRHCNAC